MPEVRNEQRPSTVLLTAAQLRASAGEAKLCRWQTIGASHEAYSKTICYFCDALLQIVRDEDASGRFLIRALYSA